MSKLQPVRLSEMPEKCEFLDTIDCSMNKVKNVKINNKPLPEFKPTKLCDMPAMFECGDNPSQCATKKVQHAQEKKEDPLKFKPIRLCEILEFFDLGNSSHSAKKLSSTQKKKPELSKFQQKRISKMPKLNEITEGISKKKMNQSIRQSIMNKENKPVVRNIKKTGDNLMQKDLYSNTPVQTQRKKPAVSEKFRYSTYSNYRTTTPQTVDPAQPAKRSVVKKIKLTDDKKSERKPACENCIQMTDILSQILEKLSMLEKALVVVKLDVDNVTLKSKQSVNEILAVKQIVSNIKESVSPSLKSSKSYNSEKEEPVDLFSEKTLMELAIDINEIRAREDEINNKYKTKELDPLNFYSDNHIDEVLNHEIEVTNEIKPTEYEMNNKSKAEEIDSLNFNSDNHTEEVLNNGTEVTNEITAREDEINNKTEELDPLNIYSVNHTDEVLNHEIEVTNETRARGDEITNNSKTEEIYLLHFYSNNHKDEVLNHGIEVTNEYEVPLAPKNSLTQENSQLEKEYVNNISTLNTEEDNNLAVNKISDVSIEKFKENTVDATIVLECDVSKVNDSNENDKSQINSKDDNTPKSYDSYELEFGLETTPLPNCEKISSCCLISNNDSNYEQQNSDIHCDFENSVMAKSSKPFTSPDLISKTLSPYNVLNEDHFLCTPKLICKGKPIMTSGDGLNDKKLVSRKIQEKLILLHESLENVISTTNQS